jgi:hypothetical protein
VIVTGTRESNVKARDSAAPIDVLPAKGGYGRTSHLATALQATGATDLRDALERVLPSVNHAAFGGDYGALTDTVQLRGLSPDHVLILVNGWSAGLHEIRYGRQVPDRLQAAFAVRNMNLNGGCAPGVVGGS